MSDLPERIGKAINELDIDFGRFTIAGWCVCLASLSLGFLVAMAAYWAVVGKIQNDKGPALLFGLALIGTTVVVFLSLRALLSTRKVRIVKDRDLDQDHVDQR